MLIEHHRGVPLAILFQSRGAPPRVGSILTRLYGPDPLQRALTAQEVGLCWRDLLAVNRECRRRGLPWRVGPNRDRRRALHFASNC
jgi:hypothetical protein